MFSKKAAINMPIGLLYSAPHLCNWKTTLLSVSFKTTYYDYLSYWKPNPLNFSLRLLSSFEFVFKVFQFKNIFFRSLHLTDLWKKNTWKSQIRIDMFSSKDENKWFFITFIGTNTIVCKEHLFHLSFIFFIHIKSIFHIKIFYFTIYFTLFLWFFRILSREQNIILVKSHGSLNIIIKWFCHSFSGIFTTFQRVMFRFDSGKYHK